MVTQLKTVNGRQFGFNIKIEVLQTKINFECSPLAKEQSSSSEAGVRSEIFTYKI